MDGENINNQTPETQTKQPAETLTKSEHDQIGYLTRKQQEAEKQRDQALAELEQLRAKLQELENERLSETERKEREAKLALEEAERLRRETARLKAIMQNQLPPELAELVPEGLDDPDAYIKEKLMPIKERLVSNPTGAIGAPTQPSKEEQPSEDEKLLQQWDALIARNAPEQVVQEFYNQNADKLRPLLLKRR